MRSFSVFNYLVPEWFWQDGYWIKLAVKRIDVLEVIQRQSYDEFAEKQHVNNSRSGHIWFWISEFVQVKMERLQPFQFNCMMSAWMKLLNSLQSNSYVFYQAFWQNSVVLVNQTRQLVPLRKNWCWLKPPGAHQGSVLCVSCRMPSGKETCPPKRHDRR